MAYSKKDHKIFMYIEMADGTKHRVPVEGVD
jgi:hypothetical protein